MIYSQVKLSPYMMKATHEVWRLGQIRTLVPAFDGGSEVSHKKGCTECQGQNWRTVDGQTDSID